MLRVSPALSGERIVQANNFRIEPGGSESNVAIAIANLNMESQFVSRLPNNELKNIIFQQLKQFSVGTNYITLGGKRVGIYWTETGTGPRNSYVIYDREDSSFAESKYIDYNWDEILNQSKWFHFSGISPAVSQTVTETLRAVVKKCKCPYSIDLNYRSKLWGWVKKNPLQINKIMTELSEKATLLIGNESDFSDIFGIDSEEMEDKEKYLAIADKVFEKFNNAKYIAISNRNSISASVNHWNGYFFVRNDEQFCYKGVHYNIENIQDRVGTGDSFAAGIIYGINNKFSNQKVIDFAVALSALNHTTFGDASRFNVQDVENALKTQGSGRIVR